MGAGNSLVDVLQDAARFLIDHNHPAGTLIAAAYDRALAGEPLEEALGHYGAWRHAYRARRRNAALAALADCFPGMQGRRLAAAIGSAVRRYAATGWERDRARGRRPDGISGLCYDLLAVGEVPSYDHLRRILREIGSSGLRQ